MMNLWQELPFARNFSIPNSTVPNNLNMDEEYYIGFIFHNDMEIMDLVIEGNDINNVTITNATVAKANA